MDGYLAWLRDRVGHGKIKLVFAVACVVHDDAVLLQQRADTGGWGFPGGALELGETAHEAAVRETAEETGVAIAVTQLIGVYTAYEQRYPNGDVAQPILIAFRAIPVGAAETTDSQPWETVQARYVPLGDVPPLFSAQHRDVLSDLVAGSHGIYR